MDFINNLALGFTTAALPINLLFCFVGVLIGTLIGVLPGIGPTATIAMLMPIALSLSPEAALIMLAGIYYGAQYGGSTTAILINVPGESSAAVTALDGHQLARQGRAGPALAIAAIGSFIAGTIATLVIAVFAPPLTAIAIQFGPAEYVALIVLGLISSIALARGSVLKAFAMLMLGLLLGVVGTDIYTGAQRFTFGMLGLSDGLNFVAIAIGAFGLAEVIRNLESEDARSTVASRVTGLMPTREDWGKIIMPILRGTVLGSVLGILPGAGAVLAAFAAYAVEKKISRTPELFGKGAVEGVAGPESANNASAQTSFIPMLTLGIPANPVMALMIGAMIIQGIIPGPNVVVEQPALFWGTIASMWIGNLMLLLLNLPLVGIWVKLLTIPYYVLFPAILAFSAIGVYSVSGNIFDLYTLAAFGAGSYALSRLGCEPAPLLLGFVLGPMLEEHVRRGMMLFDGDPLMFFQRPISATLLAAAAILLAALSAPSIMKARQKVFTEND